MNVPLCEMYIDDEIKQKTLEVLESGIFVNGQNVEKFEQEFAEYIGVKYGIAVNSGTSALYIIFKYLDLQPGDEVIVPSLTFIASASQAIQLGAKPVFVECDPHNFTLDVEDLRAKITEKTRAIVAVHLYGHPVDMDPIMELAEKNNIYVIEDCAQSHGSKYKGRITGSIGHFAAFSFFPSKIMNVCGDGGMILTNDQKAAEKMRMLKDHGRRKKYEHEFLGMNMRMSEIPAAIGRIQLKRLNQFISQRKYIVEQYYNGLGSLNQIELPEIEPFADPVFYIMVIKVSEREKLMSYLKSQGISTGIHYPIPLHLQPVIVKKFGVQHLPVTEYVCSRIITLPLSSVMNDAQAKYVIDNIKHYFNTDYAIDPEFESLSLFPQITKKINH